MEETGARINVPPFRVQKNEIVVSGEIDDVIWCKATIMSIYQEKKRKCQTKSFKLRKSQHKYVIGPRGSNLQEILANTGVSVEVPLRESPSETITLRGEQEKLGLALKMVYSEAVNNVIYADVNAPNWLHRFIIGKKGENIKRITQVCPQVHFKFLEGQDKIQVTGPREEVEIGVAELHDYVKDLQSRMDFAEVEIEQRFHKYIIGKAGANIRKVRNETGVMIRIPSDAENSPIIRIEGDQKGVEKAKQKLIKIASRMARKNEINIKIQEKLHTSIIDAKECLISSNMDECGGVVIHFPAKGSTSDKTINIAGRRRILTGEGSHKSDSKSYKCNVCDKRFCTKGRMEQHNKDFSHHGCKFNSKKLSTKRKLRRQKNYTHCECYACEKGYTTEREQWQDLDHKDSKSYKCNVCDKRFSTKSRMEQHKRHHKDFSHHGCKFFSKRLSTKRQMRRQKNCKKGYTTDSEPLQHLDYKDFRRYECDICDEEHSTKRNMWQHLRHHKDFRRYECDICDEERLAKRKMWQHLRHHKDFKRYKCDVCDEEYSAKWEPWQCLRSQKDFRCYECDVCGKGYSTQRGLWKHLSHHKGKDISFYTLILHISYNCFKCLILCQ